MHAQEKSHDLHNLPHDSLFLLQVLATRNFIFWRECCWDPAGFPPAKISLGSFPPRLRWNSAKILVLIYKGEAAKRKVFKIEEFSDTLLFHIYQ